MESGKAVTEAVASQSAAYPERVELDSISTVGGQVSLVYIKKSDGGVLACLTDKVCQAKR